MVHPPFFSLNAAWTYTLSWLSRLLSYQRKKSHHASDTPHTTGYNCYFGARLQKDEPQFLLSVDHEYILFHIQEIS